MSDWQGGLSSFPWGHCKQTLHKMTDSQVLKKSADLLSWPHPDKTG